MRTAVCFAIGISLGVVSAAQTPAIDSTEPLRLVSLSHFRHVTDTLEPTLAFYKAVFDFDAPMPRTNASPGVALLNNTPGIVLRSSTPKFPGETFGIEMTEFSNVTRNGGQGGATDPGAPELILPVRDLDAVVVAARKAGAPIVTRSGAPVTLTTASGKTRAIIIRDNDGAMIRVVEVPATMLGMMQPGVSMAVAVKNLHDTAAFYHDVVGIELMGAQTFVRDEAMADLVGAPPHSEYRVMSFSIPRHELGADGVLRVEGHGTHAVPSAQMGSRRQRMGSARVEH